MSLSLSPLVLWLVGRPFEVCENLKQGRSHSNRTALVAARLKGRPIGRAVVIEGETEERRQRIASQLYGRVANAFRAVLDVCVGILVVV